MTDEHQNEDSRERPTPRHDEKSRERPTPRHDERSHDRGGSHDDTESRELSAARHNEESRELSAARHNAESRERSDARHNEESRERSDATDGAAEQESPDPSGQDATIPPARYPGTVHEQGAPKLPFNDYKHPPTRPEIDLQLGVVHSAELRRFEHQLELMEPRVNWAMHWYENETGWGYRASYKARVLCVLHFYRGFFTVTLSIPIDQEEQYFALRELTPGLRKAFDHFTLSTKMKWFTFHVNKAKDVDALLAILRLKYADLKSKTSKG